MRPPTYKGLRPASPKASKAARGASKKMGTQPEVLLRKALWHAGYRYRKNVQGIPGRPDLAFLRARVVVFCDGDFWHGNDWPSRRLKLQSGHNAEYWIAKIERNMERDRQQTGELERNGWVVVRVWESEIKRDLGGVVQRVQQALKERH